MTDPYQVLGVDRNATDDEIKSAYRNLAKKYHPDNYAGSPLADLASEKMKEINEAYDTVTKSRQQRKESRENNSSYSGGETHFAEIRSFIEMNNFYEADVRLNAVPQEERNAEWFYLKGRVFEARGWSFEAAKNYDTAINMEPENAEYRAARENITDNARNFRGGGGNVTGGGCGPCDCCSSLICADCCCEACGGDLISCC